MTRTLKATWLIVALASTLTANLLMVRAQEPGGEDPVPVPAKADKFKDIQKQLDQIREGLIKDFQDLNQNLGMNFGEVKKDMDKLDKAVKQLQQSKIDQDVNLADLQGKINDLQDALGKMGEELFFLKSKLADVKLYPPYKAYSPPAANVGRIVLINNTNEEILFIINNQAHRVAAFGTKNLEAFPAGVVSYEVLSQTFGSLRKNTTTLNANETFTIRVG